MKTEPGGGSQLVWLNLEIFLNIGEMDKYESLNSP